MTVDLWFFAFNAEIPDTGVACTSLIIFIENGQKF